MFEGTPARNIPRVLFTELYGHDDMITFMSSYQCQDKTGKHYHPKGYLCWYECNRYGEPTGRVIPIKKVPEFVWIYSFSEKGYQKLKRDREKEITMRDIITKEPRASPLATTEKKIKLCQRAKRSKRS